VIIGGAAAGLAQPPLFAAASSLPANRATTASAVLNMSRQVGSALGVALLVALMGGSSPHLLRQFQHGWWLEFSVALAAALVLVSAASRRRRS